MDYEERIGKENDKLESQKYQIQCENLYRCFSDTEKKDKGRKVVEVNPFELMKNHPFFHLISNNALREMLNLFPMVKLKDNQLLYKEGDPTHTAFIILFGKLVIHSKELGAIGMVKMGDMVGEEFLFETKRQKRHENVYAEDVCYLLEVSRESYTKEML